MKGRVLVWMYVLALVALVGAMVWTGLAACHPPVLGGVCQVGEMRCHDNVAEICASDRTWVPALDCRAITEHAGRPWVCAPVPRDAGVGDADPTAPVEDDEFTCRPSELVS